MTLTICSSSNPNTAKTELTVYKAVEGKGIAPKVLALVQDDDSTTITGFVLQFIPGDEAQKQNKAGCVDVLLTLHNAGFAHGDTHAKNFIVSSSGIIKLIDFERSVPANDDTMSEDFM